jgi:hypothetical protein
MLVIESDFLSGAKTVRDFDPSLAEAKSITPTIYQRVGDIHRGSTYPPPPPPYTSSYSS